MKKKNKNTKTDTKPDDRQKNVKDKVALQS